MTLAVLGYYGGRLIIAVINYNGVIMRSNCFSGDVQFIEGGKEALEQLDKKVQELNKANQATMDPFWLKFIYFITPIIALAIVLL